jgi:hypothetical protein
VWDSLVGVIVGGAITFTSTTGVNWFKERADRERHRRAEIAEVSIRFIRAVNRGSTELMRASSRSAEMLDKLQQLQASSNLEETLAEFQKSTSSGEVQEALGRLKTLVSTLAEAQESESPFGEAQAIIVEMRLIVPNEILTLAARTVFVAFTQKLKVVLGNTDRPLDPTNEALKQFTNAVRKEIGLNKFEPPENDSSYAIWELFAGSGNVLKGNPVTGS